MPPTFNTNGNISCVFHTELYKRQSVRMVMSSYKSFWVAGRGRKGGKVIIIVIVNVLAYHPQTQTIIFSFF